MSNDVLQELLDREQIKDVKARYLRLVDAKQWDAWRELFTDDARFEIMDSEPIVGADRFVEFTREVTKGARTVHHGHTPELTLESATEARGTWVLADYIEWEADPETGERRGMRGYGYYDERYRKVAGVWKIAGWRLTYLRIDPLPTEPLPSEIRGGPDLLRGA